MPKGRRPLPDEYKAALGLRNEYRCGGKVPKAIARDPVKPQWLSPFAAEQWDRIVGEQAEVGLLSASDLEAIAALCVAFDDLRTAHLEQQAGKPFWTDEDGNVKAHPAFTAANQATIRIRGLTDQLGRNPTARTAMKGSGIGKKAETLDDYVNLKVKRA